MNSFLCWFHALFAPECIVIGAGMAQWLSWEMVAAHIGVIRGDGGSWGWGGGKGMKRASPQGLGGGC